MATNLNDLRTTSTAMKPNGAPSYAQILEMPKEKQFPAMLQAWNKEVALALPAHLNSDRMARLALTCFRNTPKLNLCDPGSLFTAVLLASQLGLEIGVDGQCYIVPYYDNKKKGYFAQFIPGWKGYVELINRAGKAGVWTGAVYKGDIFKFALGDSPFVTHEPTGVSDEIPANLTHVYAIGRLHDSKQPVIEVWPLAKVKRHLDKYNKVGESHYGYKNLEMYGRKVALLQVMKYMPKSVELRVLGSMDNGNSTKVDVKDVLEGEWSSVAADAAVDYEENEGAGDAGTEASGSSTGGGSAPGAAAGSSTGTPAPSGDQPDPSAADLRAEAAKKAPDAQAQAQAETETVDKTTGEVTQNKPSQSKLVIE